MTQTSTKTRRELATEAFCGCNVSLWEVILDKLSYNHDGETYAANGATLGEAIDVVESMTADEIEVCLILG